MKMVKNCSEKKKKSFVDVLYVVSGAFVVFFYAIYFISCIGKAMFSSLTLPAVVMLLVVLPIAFRKKLKIILKKLYKPLKMLFLVGMCFYMVTFCIFSTVILTQSQSYSIDNIDSQKTPVVVVFGCLTRGYTPSITLANRLKRAAEVLTEQENAICIVSGSKGPNETVSEAESMKKYLVEKCGIEESRIIEDREANNSIENLDNSLKIIESLGIDSQIICVSSEFHTPRIMLLSKRAGVETMSASAKSSSLPALLSNLVREYMSYVKLFVFS